MKQKLVKLKQKVSKGKIIGVAVVILVIVGIGFGVKYIAANYIGFTDVDFADLVFIDYNKQAFEAKPELDWVGNYYDQNGYYEDFTKKLENTGLYSEEQIENYTPSLDGDTYSAIESIYQDYGLSTEEPLKNGDSLEVTINYSAEKAKEEKINVVNNVVTFEIKGLYGRVEAKDISAASFDQVGGLKQIKSDALNNNLDLFDMTYEIPNYKIYLEGIDEDSSSTANAFQKIDIVYQEKDSYNDLDLDPDYYVCNRQFNVYKTGGEVKLDDANDGDMYCLNKKSIDDTLNQPNARQDLGIENSYTELSI